MPVLGSATSTSTSGLGIYVPSGWGANARTAFAAAKAGTGKAVVNCAGDSLTAGQQASSLRVNSWVGLMKTALQAATSDGGSGYASAGINNLNPNGYGTSGGAWSISGAWTTSYSVDYGGAPASMGITAAVGNGVTVTATSPALRGRYITLYYGTYGTDESTVGPTSIAWTLDGTAQTALNTIRGDGTTGRKVAKVTIDTGSTGTTTHTIVVSVTGTSPTTYGTIFGASGEHATGTIVNQFGKPGARAGSFAAVGSAQDFENPALWSGGASYPGDLHISGIGVNDSAQATFDPATWSRQVRLQFDKVLAAKAGLTDLMIVVPHVGKWDLPGTTNPGYQELAERAHGLAAVYGAALVDLWTLGRNSWDWMNNQGYWGNVAVTTGAAGTDNVHLSNAGHAWWWAQMSPIILPLTA